MLYGFNKTDVARIFAMLLAFESGRIGGGGGGGDSGKGGDGGDLPESLLVRIHSTAPGAERYWVQILQGKAGDIDPDEDTSLEELGNPFPADNATPKTLAINIGRAEDSAGHTLKIGSVYHARPLKRRKNGALIVTIEPTGSPVAVVTVGPAMSMGYYNGGTFAPTTLPDGIDVSQPLTVGSFGSGVNCVFANVVESGLAEGDTPRLRIGSLGIGVFVGQSNEDPPRPIFAGVAFTLKKCSTEDPNPAEI